MGILQRLDARLTSIANEEYRQHRRSAFYPTGLSLSDYAGWLGGSGLPMPMLKQTLVGNEETIDPTFVGYAQSGYAGNAIVFACMQARLMLFSEARFQFRRIRSGRPGELFGTSALARLERPWPGGTTGDLLARMMVSNDLAGNAFVVATPNGGVRVARPDWVTMVLGSDRGPAATVSDVDAELIALVYHPGGKRSGSKPEVYLRGEFAHFAPLPDPLSPFRGMPWIAPIVREVMGDAGYTTHKLKFLENGATPNMVVSLDKDIDETAFDAFVDSMDRGHKGLANAYRTLYLAGGATATVVGADLQQMDFKAVQGAGETRIAAAAGVPPVVAGFSEGLSGSSLNAGNYSAARRRFADLTMRPLWRNAAGSLASLVPAPTGSELWYDDRDISFLQEDVSDAAEILQKESVTIRTLVDAGFQPDAVVDAVTAGDMTRLKGNHSDLFSVQLQSPGANSGGDEPSLIEQVKAGILTENEAREMLGRAPIDWSETFSIDEITSLIEQVKGGILTENEVRAKLRLPPMEWGDGLTPEEVGSLIEQVKSGLLTETEARAALGRPPIDWGDAVSAEESATIIEQVKAGIRTENEARELLNLPPIDWGSDMSAEDIASLIEQVKEGLLTVDEARELLGRPAAVWPEDLSEKVKTLGELIKAGFDPGDVLRMLGLGPIAHLGLPPVTVQKPLDAAGVEPPAPDTGGEQ